MLCEHVGVLRGSEGTPTRSDISLVFSARRFTFLLSRVIDYDLNETTYKTQTNIIAKRETHKSTFHL